MPMPWRRRKSDPNARRAAIALGGARAGLGLGVLLATRPTLKALLFGETDSRGRALAKLAGGRDLALGLATIAARDDENALRQMTIVAAMLDAADGISLGLAAREPETRLAGLGGILSGGGAALVGFWAARRLGGD